MTVSLVFAKTAARHKLSQYYFFANFLVVIFTEFSKNQKENSILGKSVQLLVTIFFFLKKNPFSYCTIHYFSLSSPLRSGSIKRIYLLFDETFSQNNTYVDIKVARRHFSSNVTDVIILKVFFYYQTNFIFRMQMHLPLP